MKPDELALPLFALLERAGTVSIPQAAQLLGATEEDVYNALEQLLFVYDSAAGVRLELGDEGSAFARLETSGKQTMRLTAVETDALLDALEAAGVGSGSELAAKLVAAKGFLGEDGSAAQLRTTEPGEDGGTLQTIAAACDEETHCGLRITHLKDGADHAQSRIVDPWRIVSQNGHRYLRGWCFDAQAMRDFRLDRIQSIEAVELDEEQQEQSRAGASAASTPLSAAVLVAADAKLPDWPGMKTRQQADGTTLVTLPWLGSRWLPKQVAAGLGAYTPLEPQALVSATRHYASELLTRL